MIIMYWFAIILKLFVGVVVGQSQNGEGSPVSTGSITCGDVPPSCEDNEFRSYDGTCNNLERSWWGAAVQPYERLLTATYSDGIHAMPISETNASLPNPRTCSLRTYVELDDPDVLWTLLFMQYGQILAHDISLTAGVPQTNLRAFHLDYDQISVKELYDLMIPVRPLPAKYEKGAITCCDQGQLTTEGQTNPRCAPIDIPDDDPYNAPEGIQCMDFLRTLTTGDVHCTGVTKVEEPLSAVSAYLDVSFIYGSDQTTANRVREFQGGRLKFVIRKGKVLLPQDPEPFLACEVDAETEPCYFTGDDRVNQNPQLAILHNIFLAQHNHIATALALVNPLWDDERLFQVTRKIVIAKHQHVTYTEYLPVIMGFENMVDNKLLYLDATGYIFDYDSTVNAAPSIEYASAAFRRFHSEIEGYLSSYKANRKEDESHVIRLYEWFGKPSICEQGHNFNGLSIGLATQAQSANNRYHTNDVTNFMFAPENSMGKDLKAIDIQRGRDHGTGSYVQALKFFGLADVKSFKDLEQFMPANYVKIAESLYASVNDIDLVWGLSLENRSPDSLSGPLTKAILIDQYKRSRIGDRYFYENGQGKHAFTPEQLVVIRRSTIREFMCYNRGIKHIQREAFKLISGSNPLLPCKIEFNALPWKEIL